MRVPASLLSEADRRWESFAAAEPYFSILSAPKYRRATLTDAARAEFFASGERLVAAALRTIELRLAPHFAPTRILEYGCGVGRLVLPLARRARARNGTVTGVDRSAVMRAHTRDAAARDGLTNVRAIGPAELLTADDRFDFIVCYLLLQRLTPADGLSLVSALARRLSPGGIGLFQLPYETTAPAFTRAVRSARETIGIVNTAINLVKRQPAAQPFVPSHCYDVNMVLRTLETGGFPAAHVVFDDHDDLASAIVYVEAPVSTQPQLGVVTAVDRGTAPAVAAPIDVRTIIDRASLADLNAAAEQYFASLTDWEHHLAKPFSSADEAPWLLSNLAVLLQSLHLTPGSRVLEFGAGTGWLSRFLTQLGCEVVLLDVSPTALRIARELYVRQPVIGDRPAPSFLAFDGLHIDLPDESVDRVVCFHAFHHAANPDVLVREFGRILRPGGRAAFAEPGPRHSQTPQSQFEMRTYGVVENDVDVHALWGTARTAGFSDVRLMAFNGTSFEVSLDEYEDLLRAGGVAARWTASTVVFLRNVRSFYLVKAGVEATDSRHADGLACEIHASLVADPVAGAPIVLEIRVTNTGRAEWLAAGATWGGVSIGARVSRGEVQVAAHVLDTALTDPPRRITPGETIITRASIPGQPAGQYRLEIDLVSARVGWFAQLGSRHAVITIDVQPA